MPVIPSLSVDWELTSGVKSFDLKVVSGTKVNVFLRVTQDGVAKDITGTTWTLKYANEERTWQEEVVGSISDAAGGVAVFEIDEDVVQVGNHVASIDVTSDGNPVYWLFGRLRVLENFGGVVAPPPSATFDWSLYTGYSSVVSDGPYTEGTDITFGAQDGQGKVSINFSGDASTVPYDPTTSELTATDVQNAIDEVDARLDQISGSITITARNETGVEIPKGKVVYISGSTGNRSTIALANAGDGNTAQRTIGVTFEAIPNNSDGEIVVLGELTGIDLDLFADGDELYLSTTAGELTNAPPVDDADWSYRIGYAEIAKNNGKLLVAPQFRGTKYGANFFAATSASGVRTLLDVPTTTDLSDGLALKADDNVVVKITGTQNVSGKKTFTTSIASNIIEPADIINESNLGTTARQFTNLRAVNYFVGALRASGLDGITFIDGTGSLTGVSIGGFANDAKLYSTGKVIIEAQFVQGLQNVASGLIAFAQGYQTTASGSESHSEGTGTTASGTGSHAEGNGTVASGGWSHAEGSNTEASGSESHAEGTNSVASGTGSHAEGQGCIATGNWSHAEGRACIANAPYSHAEGQSNSTGTTANYSSVRGYQNQANGQYSFCGGRNSVASGFFAHADGYNAQATEAYSRAIGRNAVATHEGSLVICDNVSKTNVQSSATNSFRADFANGYIFSGGKMTHNNDIQINSTSSGLILTSPNLTQYRITVDNSGNLTTTAI